MTNKITVILFAIIGFLGMASCSESDGKSAEYANWQPRNDAYFEQCYDSAVNNLNGWERIKDLTYSQTSEGAHTDYILVKKLKAGTGTESPLYNDTVRVHYRGWLIPSVSYPVTGYQFDSSWLGNYDEKAMVPMKGGVSGFVTGFSTALQYMHVGDRWLVVIPYKLGYGSTDHGTVPAYSTLRFDLTLHSFGRVGKKLPDFQ